LRLGLVKAIYVDNSLPETLFKCLFGTSFLSSLSSGDKLNARCMYLAINTKEYASDLRNIPYSCASAIQITLHP